MDILTILVDALLLTILARVFFALLRVVHRRELTLARQHDRARPGAPVPIRTYVQPPALQRQALHRARHGGHSQGA